MNTPDVSVLMAVYNAGEKGILDLAIKSILAQKDIKFELLICDDASTDHTSAWLAEWEKKDHRVRVHRNENNQRAAGARNHALRYARGRYTAIMDADDYCVPERLSIQAAFLDAHPEISFVGSRGRYFSKQPMDRTDEYWFVQQPEKWDFLMTLPFVHASIMFRTEVLRNMNGYCRSRSVTRSEDYELLMRLYAHGFRGCNLDDSLYHVRMDQNTFWRRKYRYRFCEVLVKWNGFRKMGLFPLGIPYALKPLIVGLIPHGILEKMKKTYYKNKQSGT